MRSVTSEVRNVVHGLESSADTVTWTVVVPKEDDYVVNVLFSKREQTQLEVRSGDAVLTGPVHDQDLGVSPLFLAAGTTRHLASEGR